MFRNRQKIDSVSIKCKYYGYINFHTVYPDGRKFPFNDINELRKLGSKIIHYQKLTRKSFRDLNISIDKELLKIETRKSKKLVYNFRSDKHYNPWSCLVYAPSKKMIVIMALTRDLNLNLIVTCDIVKLLEGNKKINNFINIYKTFYIKTNRVHYLNLENETYGELNYYNLVPIETSLDTIPENEPVEEFYDNASSSRSDMYDELALSDDDNNGYMEIGYNEEDYMDVSLINNDDNN